MKHYLTFKDENSNKFWQIEVAGKSFSVTYGKADSAGTSQTKTFATDEECLKEAEKLLNEKLKKGYAPAADSGRNYLDGWQAIIDSSDRSDALKNHFILCGVSKVAEDALEKICSQVREVKIENGKLTISLPWRLEKTKSVVVTFDPPHTGHFDKSIPASFRKFYKGHNGLFYTHDDRNYESFSIAGVNEDGAFDDGGVGSWDSCYVEDGGNEGVIEYLEGKEMSVADIVCFGTYDDGQNWYLLHPIKKNTSREPSIVLFDHGGCDMEDELSDYTLADFVITELSRHVLGRD